MLLYPGPGPDDWVASNPDNNCGTLTLRSGLPVTVNATFKGYTCPADQGQQCIAPLDNPDYGFNGFDNFGEALLYMMQVRCWADACSQLLLASYVRRLSQLPAVLMSSPCGQQLLFSSAAQPAAITWHTRLITMEGV